MTRVAVVLALGLAVLGGCDFDPKNAVALPDADSTGSPPVVATMQGAEMRHPPIDSKEDKHFAVLIASGSDRYRVTKEVVELIALVDPMRANQVADQVSNYVRGSASNPPEVLLMVVNAGSERWSAKVTYIRLVACLSRAHPKNCGRPFTKTRKRGRLFGSILNHGAIRWWEFALNGQYSQENFTPRRF